MKKINKPPSVIFSDGQIFRYSSRHTKKRELKKDIEKKKKYGFRVRSKYLNINGKNSYVLYLGRRKGKSIKKKKKR